MPIANEMLEKLCCPQSGEALAYFEAGVAGDEEFLFCPYSKRRYRFDGGVPVLLSDEAELLDDDTCLALNSKAQELGLL